MCLTHSHLAFVWQTLTKAFISHTRGMEGTSRLIWTMQQQNHWQRPLPCCSLYCQDTSCMFRSLVDNSLEISYLVVQMVLSTNSGSRLPMDSLGIGRGCAAKAMPSICLEVYWVYRPWPWRKWSSLCGSCHSTVSVLDSNPIFQIFLQICLENELKIQDITYT